MTIGNTRVQGMEVHASDREIVEAAVTQDGKLRACGRGRRPCWCVFFVVTAITKIGERVATLTYVFVLYQRRILPLCDDDQRIIHVLRRQLAGAREQRSQSRQRSWLGFTFQFAV